MHAKGVTVQSHREGVVRPRVVRPNVQGTDTFPRERRPLTVKSTPRCRMLQSRWPHNCFAQECLSRALTASLRFGMEKLPAVNFRSPMEESNWSTTTQYSSRRALTGVMLIERLNTLGKDWQNSSAHKGFMP